LFYSARREVRGTWKEKAETTGQSANKPNPAERLMLQEPEMSRRFDSATFH
jgi:hypothetical protein